MANHGNQHYLARSYLKGFGDRNYKNEAIWQYRKSTNEIRLKGIGKVARGRHIYSIKDSSGGFDPTLEQAFGGIETWWPSLLKKIRSNFEAVDGINEPLRVTEYDRVKILQYMLIHFLRVPKYMKWMRRHVEEHHPRRNHLTADEVHNLRIHGLSQTYNSIVKDWVKFLNSKELSLEASPAGSKATMFTCDNPVIIFNPEGADGIAFETTHVLFPMDRRRFIRWAGIDDTRDKTIVKVRHDRDFIDEFNRHVVEIATDEIYAARPDPLYCLLCRMDFNPNLRLPKI